MPLENPRPAKEWCMYPSRHNDVSDLLQVHGLFFNFYKNDDGKNCIKEYDTNIMGRFTCRNSACPAGGWTSKRVAITIRLYSNERYNATVYHQRCKSCGRLSTPHLDDSYADRVAYRIKKWCGVQVERPPFSGRSDGPHRSDLCVGCKLGHCSEA
jgi:Zinc-binding domain